MVGFPSMSWLILPSVHYKARKVENWMVTWKYNLAMIFFKQKKWINQLKTNKKRCELWTWRNHFDLGLLCCFRIFCVFCNTGSDIATPSVMPLNVISHTWWPSSCVITLVAFYWLFSTVIPQMKLQRACVIGGIFTLVAFVHLLATVYFHVHSHRG